MISVLPWRLRFTMRTVLTEINPAVRVSDLGYAKVFRNGGSRCVLPISVNYLRGVPFVTKSTCLLAVYSVAFLCGPWLNAAELRYENLELVIDDEVIIAPASAEVSAANMVVDAEGSIWVNSTTTSPGLFKSTDGGKTWSTTAIHVPDAPGEQYVAGFAITWDRRLWIIHQEPPKGGGHVFSDDVFVSTSTDQGLSWQTTKIDFPNFAPNAPKDPYTSMSIAWCHPNVIERPDGTVMFSASMRYEDWGEYQQTDQTRPGVRDVMIRTRDGGKTWGDPTIVHQHATETAYAVDPNDPNHIFAATRVQRRSLLGEDPAEVLEKTGVPYPPKPKSWVYKNGLLLKSKDGGRTFREVPNSLLGFGSYRFSMVWTKSNMIVLVSLGGQEPGEAKFDNDHVVRLSLDGGHTWADGTPDGTTGLNQARKFSVVPSYRDVGKADHYSAAVASTVSLPGDRFLTLCRYKRDKILKGRIWHLENVR